LELTVQKNLEEVPHTLMVVGVNVVVPLFEPGDEFGKAGQQRRQALYDPAFPYKCISEPFGFYLRKAPMPGVRLYSLARSRSNNQRLTRVSGSLPRACARAATWVIIAVFSDVS
jgi:hypothetical protein